MAIETVQTGEGAVLPPPIGLQTGKPEEMTGVDESSVKNKLIGGHAVQGGVVADPSKMDSVEKKEVTENQDLRSKGVVSSNGTTPTYSTDSDSPVLPTSSYDTSSITTIVNRAAENAWFNTSGNFFAAVSQALNNMIDAMAKSKFAMGTMSIEVQKGQLDMGKSSAELTKAEAMNQAMQSITEAMQNVAAAGMAALQYRETVANANTAKNDPEVMAAKASADRTQNELDTHIAQKDAIINAARDGVVGQDPRAVAAAGVQAETDWDARLKTLTAANNETQKNYEMVKSNVLKHLDQMTESKYRGLTSANTAVADVAKASLQITGGNIRAAKDILESQKQVMQKLQESVDSAHKDYDGFFDAAIQLLMKVQDAHHLATQG